MTMRMCDYMAKIAEEEKMVLPSKFKRCFASLRDHVEDNITSLCGDSLIAFSKASPGPIEWQQGDDKYENLVGDEYWEGVKDDWADKVQISANSEPRHYLIPCLASTHGLPT
jgi:hypothetical protein